MNARERTGARGSTLLEVALAVALLAMGGIGQITMQLSMSRHGQRAALRGQAAFIADAFAETQVEGGIGIGAGDQWKARTSVLIPDGAVSTEAAGAYALRATVGWPASSYGPALAGPAASVACPGSTASLARECVSLVFAR